MIGGGRMRWSAAAAALVVLLTQVKVLGFGAGVVERIKQRGAAGGSYVGLLMTFPLEVEALGNSGVFLPSPLFPSPVQLAGRKFHIGSIRGVNVIWVMSGEKTVNAGVTTQILYDVFDTIGVVHYGIAGSTNASLRLGDVSVPSHLAFTSSWDWKELGSSELDAAGNSALNFGAFNLPRKGANLLGRVEFTPVELYSNHSPMKKLFWLPVDPNWFTLATQLKDTVLERCLNHTDCLPQPPKASFGLKGATADVYMNNAAYGSFLLEEFNVSTVDEESAAVVMTSLSNGRPCVVFRGVSDFEGGRDVKLPSMSMAALAATNALNLAVEFIELIGNLNAALISM